MSVIMDNLPHNNYELILNSLLPNIPNELVDKFKKEYQK
jgi:hypothetical protein